MGIDTLEIILAVVFALNIGISILEKNFSAWAGWTMALMYSMLYFLKN